jgi:hypothetical protein
LRVWRPRLPGERFPPVLGRRELIAGLAEIAVVILSDDRRAPRWRADIPPLHDERLGAALRTYLPVATDPLSSQARLSDRDFHYDTPTLVCITKRRKIETRAVENAVLSNIPSRRRSQKGNFRSASTLSCSSESQLGVVARSPSSESWLRVPARSRGDLEGPEFKFGHPIRVCRSDCDCAQSASLHRLFAQFARSGTRRGWVFPSEQKARRAAIFARLLPPDPAGINEDPPFSPGWPLICSRAVATHE